LSSSAESSGQVEETPSEQPATDQNTSSTADQENASGHSAGDHPAACRRGPNHGRIPASRYTGCAKVIVNHESLRPGDACPHCVNGTLYRQSAWSLVVRLKGQPPVTGEVYHRERLRCHDCGQVFTAALPAEAGPNKYDPSVASVVATLRYGEGFPWNRLQRTQRFAGVPLPASDQWERVRDAADRGPRAVYQHLCWLGAQGELLHHDDTAMCVLQLTGMIKRHEPLLEEDPDRRGVFTTGILSLAEGRPTIALYVTGPHHAGENLRTLLAARCPELPLPLGMCDGLSRNMPHDLRVIMANCLVHGRRYFVDVVAAFPAEVEHVLECLKIIYKVDAQAKEQQLSPNERLQLHQEQSGPVMDELHRWLKTRFDERLVEPNSSLGKAISYMLKHWGALTRFLHVPGAPLDNNVCERALKMAIRHRNNSLFYRTPRGAAVGDLYMSLIYTCYLSGVSPVDYLTELQRNHERVRAAPGDWLPWNYRRQLVAAKSDAEVEVGRGPPGDAPLSTTCSPSN
jgi:transposase